MRRPMFSLELTREFLSAAALAVAVVFSFVAPNPAEAGPYKLLHSFCSGGSCGDGSQPMAALTMDLSGNLFGTTATGGRGFHGVVFELTRSDTAKFKFHRLHTFCPLGNCADGANPHGTLIVDADGNLYGTTLDGGSAGHGIVYKLVPGPTGWTETVLYSFCMQINCPDGYAPVAGLTYAGAASGAPYDGTSPLYGTTAGGGPNGDGTVFELTRNGGQWTETVIYNFCSTGGASCTDGVGAQNGLLMDGLGNLFGTTLGGGNDFSSNGAGVAFELTPNGDGSWTQTVLYRFCSAENCVDGAAPIGTLIMDAAGTLFGATRGGGTDCRLERPYGCGTIYKLIPNGTSSQETVLYSFCMKKDCKDGADPGGGVILDSLGNLFGTTFAGGGNDTDDSGIGGGTAFELSAGSLKILHRFCGVPNCGDGEYPDAGLVMDSAGFLYGVTNFGGVGGVDSDSGTVFQLRP